MSAPELGVVFTKCRKCGGSVVPLRDVIKCTECSWIDERKLSNRLNNGDFVSPGPAATGAKGGSGASG